MSVSIRGTCQQWPAPGTEALAASDLGGTACEPHYSHQADNPKTGENYTKEVLAMLQKFKGPQHISQPEDTPKGVKTPRECDFEG